MAQLIPTYELVQFSTRGGEDATFTVQSANQYSYPVYHLPTVLFPRFFSADDTYWGKRLEIEYGFFIGTLPLLLLLFYKKNKDNKFFFWLAIITFLLALGEW